MKTKSLQNTMLLRDPVRRHEKRQKMKPAKSVVKFRLTEDQLAWAIGHNLTWVMGQVKPEGQA